MNRQASELAGVDIVPENGVRPARFAELLPPVVHIIALGARKFSAPVTGKKRQESASQQSEPGRFLSARSEPFEYRGRS